MPKYNNKRIPPKCIECDGTGVLVTGAEIYPHRPDLHHKPFWRCTGCGAYVGCHPETQNALGLCAGPKTRKARTEAHAVFDPIWIAKMQATGSSRSQARNAAYIWIGTELGIEPKRWHISHMTAEEARRVVEICTPVIESIERKRSA